MGELRRLMRLGKIPVGQSVTGITAPTSGGYLVLTSNGGVHNYGARFCGSSAGTLPSGVKAVGIAADPATSGYWILKSDGGVDNYNAPWFGSLRGKIPVGQSVTGITAG